MNITSAPSILLILANVSSINNAVLPRISKTVTTTDSADIWPLIENNGNRYHIQYLFKANWFKAARYCRLNGMHLASVNSIDEQVQLIKQIKEIGVRIDCFWLSGTDMAEHGAFYWTSNGQPINLKWGPGQPDNSNNNERCVEIWNFEFNDSNCDKDNFFVCERSM